LTQQQHKKRKQTDKRTTVKWHKNWFRCLLCHPARKWIRPILQLINRTN